MTEMLKFRQMGKPCEIKYIYVPRCSGKTSSVLPAFLASDYFTHYLYIAFNNNDSRNFRLSRKTPFLNNSKSIKEQGVKFAVECMRILLEEPEQTGPYEVPVGPCDLQPTSNLTNEMKSLLHRNLGTNPKVLIHLDKHRQMRPRTKKKNDPGTAFSQGMMEVFGSQAVVVATYVEPPILHPPTEGTSGTCRWPVVCPWVDIELVMRHLTGSSTSRLCSRKTGPLTGFHDFLELKQKSDNPCLTPDARRLIVNLQLRFALALQGRLAFLHVPQIDGTPLERLYLWALSTQSALYGELEFRAINCPFKCSNIKKGWIFPGQECSEFDSITDVSQLETDVMFFADSH
uniref:Uncharacterized protein n=1 Tax=Chromera velia CCMP2878 TaxID=1169474 RepID=A0A0G4F848_9ALVE|eukprot:Cvel_2891.t1-p1 / transcript=Cvel_2891.t1 / gene=Cvel_2891 / organism=Chromera_velia_CCMP2878 / gene_product=hypothetical protein / transcript_product=hypothetical protein / location=Cvel_scaffold114:59718-62436(+) / protein_length=343 / sequence_SO=supercontig / SO=protein_coding / is_pseudo=false